MSRKRRDVLFGGMIRIRASRAALRAAWKVNFVDLNFGAVTAITLVSILVIACSWQR